MQKDNSTRSRLGPIDGALLRLVLLQPDVLRALGEDDIAKAAMLTGMAFADSWADAQDVITMRLGDIERDPAYLPWSLRAIVRKQDQRVVGHIGFHARPGADYSPHLIPAGVEFGYTTFVPYRRQGIARSASIQLMRWALDQGASHFIVSVAPDNGASMSLARGLGFRKVGTHVDEKDGPEDVMELRVSGNTPAPGSGP